MVPAIQRYLTMTLVTGCACLLQWHSIIFWMEQAQLGVAGIAWSLLLEGCALWLWWQRRIGARVLGLAASCLLLAGPMAQVSEPLLVAVSSAETVKFQDFTTIEILKSEISGLENSLKAYEQNSSARIGWAERIDRTQSALKQVRGRYIEAVATPAATVFPVLKLATIGGQMLALLLFQITAVLGILSLSRWTEAIPLVVEPQAAAVGLSKDVVAAALIDYSQNKNLAGQALADSLNESQTTLWRIRSPAKTVKPETLDRVMQKLEAAA